MHIGIDARAIIQRRRTGVGRWTYELIRHLRKIDKDNEYILWCYPLSFFRKNIDFQETSAAELNARICMFPNRLLHRLWDRFDFPSVELLVGEVELFQANFIAPPQKKGKTVVMIYDLTPLKFPEYHTRFVELFRKNLIRSVKRADMIIAISENTKNDICEMIDIPQEKIRVVYGGVSNSFSPLKDENLMRKVLTKYKIGARYLLYVGTLEPRKNLVRLIVAFSQLKRDCSIEHKLVLVGTKGWQYDEIFKKIAEFKLENEVIFTGYVAEEELAVLMSGAEVFIYPSLYEGFGLPPLEAMASGVPVISSDVSAITEVIGDAGVLVNPYSVDELSEAILKVVNDEELRQSLKEKGFARVNLYSWKKTAQETLAVYKEVLGS